jgi:ethanolamine phosphate phosphodiesterase
MFFHSRVIRVLLTLIPLCLLSTTYLYLYPAFHQCHFPSTSNGAVAPFRLLAFGDPQLEGDTSLPRVPRVNVPKFSTITEYLRDRDFEHLREDIQRITSYPFKYLWYHLRYARKQIDLLGNDFYLAHIYRTLHWWSDPTHVTVLGDLLGSQWIKDEEFDTRSQRYWNRVFAGSEKVSEELLNPKVTGDYVTHREVLGEDTRWRNRVLNIAGNHDIGYAGDADEDRVARFEREFGPINGDIIFTLPLDASDNSTDSLEPSIRLIIFNSMTLDGPAYSYDLQGSTIDFINSAMIHAAPVESHDTALILLTHIPLHKEPGICVDEPLFTYLPEENGSGVKEQNFLSPDASKDAILQGLFGMHSSTEAAARGMGRHGIILTGHDHEGCDVYHYANREDGTWHAQRWTNANTSALAADDDQPGIREVTVRSMMGEFSGNAALLSAWWSRERQRWSIEVSNCRLGVQHVWWAIHSLDIAVLVLVIVALALYTIELLIPAQNKVAAADEGRMRKDTKKDNPGARHSSKTKSRKA